MRKKTPRAYFVIFFSLLSLMSLSKESSESLRGSTVALFGPGWEQLIALKTFFSRLENVKEGEAAKADSEEIQRLRLENILLHNEIFHLKDVMQHELRIISQLNASKENPIPERVISLLKRRHHAELQKLLQLQLEAVPARVIFRSAASWNSSLWINAGEATNEALGRTVIAKNSPVVVGAAIVGVVDYVGKHQARIRLITDSGLTPSVRVLRSPGYKKQLIKDKINALIQSIENSNEALFGNSQSKELLASLEKGREQLTSEEEEAWYLAKGELHGASKPLWRAKGHLLKGVGFNYDFDDSKGSARDLRTGKPSDVQNNDPPIPIIQAHDLLVTTGMDGVFPPDLLVAEVKTLYFLKEGDYTYEIDAVPILENFDELSLVFVIPPMGYDADEQPPPIGW